MYGTRGAGGLGATGFRRGHGGGGGGGGGGGNRRRKPTKKRDDAGGPPPVKECRCLIELRLAEYLRPVSAVEGDGNAPANGTGRMHSSFEGGRGGMERCRRTLRGEPYRCHLVVPGRKQSGPVGIVAPTGREGIMAASLVLASLVLHDGDTASGVATVDGADDEGADGPWVDGRIFVDVHRRPDEAVEGRFYQQRRRHPTDIDGGMSQSTGVGITLRPHWLFLGGGDGADWSVLSCTLLQRGSGASRSSRDGHEPIDERDGNGAVVENDVRECESGTAPSISSSSEKTGEEGVDGPTLEQSLAALRTCVDNVRFRLGNSAAAGGLRSGESEGACGEDELDIFVDTGTSAATSDPPEMNVNATAFAAGRRDFLTIVHDEIVASLPAS